MQTMTLVDIDTIFDTFGGDAATRIMSVVEEAGEHEGGAHIGEDSPGGPEEEDFEGLEDTGEGGRDHAGSAAAGGGEAEEEAEEEEEEEEEEAAEKEEEDDGTAACAARRKLRQGIITEEEYEAITRADGVHEVQSKRMRQLSRLRQLSMDDFVLKKMLGKGAFGTVLLVQLRPELHSTMGLTPEATAGAPSGASADGAGGGAAGGGGGAEGGGAGGGAAGKAAAAGAGELANDQPHFFAVKILRKLDMSSYTKHRTQLEREIMARVSHPFIATLEFAFQSDEKLYLGMEFFQGGDLFHHIAKARRHKRNGPGIGLERARFYTAELVSALAHLHSMSIAYRDLKPSNVMLDGNGHVRLVDFGLCKQQVMSRRKARTFVGTRAYVAPEVIRMSLKYAPPTASGSRPRGYGHACDWWSLGIILFEMLSGVTPFDAQTPRRTFHNILNVEPIFPSCIKRSARALLKGLLRKDPRWRLGCEGLDRDLDAKPVSIMEHEFFTSWEGFDWELLDRKQIMPPWKPTLTGSPTDMRYATRVAPARCRAAILCSLAFVPFPLCLACCSATWTKPSQRRSQRTRPLCQAV